MRIIIVLLAAVLSYLIAGAVHEMGHVVVGLLSGWKFYLLVVGPVGIRRNENDKISVYLEKNPALWGGVGGTFPKTESPDNIKVWSKILLGGPVASIIMGCAFLPFGILTLNALLLMLGFMPIGMGIACLLPLKTGITYTDGARWRRLHGEGQVKAEEIALFKMAINDILKKDMSQIEYTDFEPLLHAELPAIKYYGYYYSYMFYKSRNDEENVQKTLGLMDSIKKNVPKIVIDDCTEKQ
ncbi:MAG: hypothetical protein LBN00_08945 [Oscillospiraceae bacterium]|nr:hypothetical protein [Oscillospiraceae bacterium]